MSLLIFFCAFASACLCDYLLGDYRMLFQYTLTIDTLHDIQRLNSCTVSLNDFRVNMPGCSAHYTPHTHLPLDDGAIRTFAAGNENLIREMRQTCRIFFQHRNGNFSVTNFITLIAYVR